MFTTLLSAALLSSLVLRGAKADEFTVATPQFTQVRDFPPLTTASLLIWLCSASLLT